MTLNDTYPNLNIFNHPLITHKLTIMRNKATPDADFKRLLAEISALMTYEVTKSLKTKPVSVETPIQKDEFKALSEPYPVIVPILRAGLGMSDALHRLLPEASVGHIGVYRDEQTHKPHEYLVKLPEMAADTPVILVDPMLATAGSAIFALDILTKRGVRAEHIDFMALLAAPEGVEAVFTSYPDIRLHVAAVDSHLNENAYIVPGLGDAGDRVFGTQ